MCALAHLLCQHGASGDCTFNNNNNLILKYFYVISTLLTFKFTLNTHCVANSTSWLNTTVMN